MTGPEMPSPEQERARAAVRTLATAPPDPAYRSRLRHAFVNGSFVALQPAGRRSPARLAALRWAALPLAAAAALAAVSILNQGPPLTLRARVGEGVVVVDGVPVPMADAAQLAQRLRPGARVRVPDGVRIELVSEGQLAIQLAGGADVALPAAPGRWFRRTARAEVRAGELRITTGARFHGARLEIETPEAAVTVTGTTLAVICEPTGTCVCVLDGRVAVARKGEGRVMVPAGRRRYVYNDNRAPEMDSMRPDEHVQLGEFRDRRQTDLGGAARE